MIATTANKERVLWFPVLALLSFGLLFVYSASSVYAAQKYHDEFVFVKKQVLYLVPALLAAFVGSKIKISWLLKNATLMFVASVALVLMTRLPGIGRRVNGAARWLALGPIQFQPAEILKFTTLLLVTKILLDKPKTLTSFWPLCFAFGALLLQPDFGSCVILAIMLFTMLFIYGLPLRTYLTSFVLILPVIALVAVAAPYRLRRIVTFLDPYADPQGAGFQVIQSFVGIASGGWLGRGLGGSQQKLFFLPEAHTDFILAVIAEEMGFIGIATIGIIFALFFYSILQIIKDSHIIKHRLLSTGIFSMFFGSTFINMGMTAGVFPTKGLPLPFVSSGGSALIANFFFVGLLTQISASQSSPSDSPTGILKTSTQNHV